MFFSFLKFLFLITAFDFLGKILKARLRSFVHILGANEWKFLEG